MDRCKYIWKVNNNVLFKLVATRIKFRVAVFSREFYETINNPSGRNYRDVCPFAVARKRIYIQYLRLLLSLGGKQQRWNLHRYLLWHISYPLRPITKNRNRLFAIIPIKKGTLRNYIRFRCLKNFPMERNNSYKIISTTPLNVIRLCLFLEIRFTESDGALDTSY